MCIHCPPPKKKKTKKNNAHKSTHMPRHTHKNLPPFYKNAITKVIHPPILTRTGAKLTI